MMFRLIGRITVVLCVLIPVISMGMWAIVYTNGDHEFMLVLSVPSGSIGGSAPLRYEGYLVDLTTGDVTPPLFRFVDLDGCNSFDLSPGHNWIAAVCRDANGQPDIFAGRIGAQVVRMTDDSDWEIALEWAANSRDMHYLLWMTNHVERVTLHLDTLTREQSFIFRDAPVWYWSADGARFVHYPMTQSPQLTIFNADGVSVDELVVGFAWESLIGWMPDNQHVLLRSSTDGRTGNRLILIDVNSGISAVAAELPTSLRCWGISAAGNILCHEVTNTYTDILFIIDPNDQTLREVELSTPLMGYWFAYP